MTSRRWLLVVAAAALLAFFGGLRCGTRPAKVDARTVALQDSLAVTRADYAKAQADRLKSARRDSLAIDSLARRAAHAVEAARALKAIGRGITDRLPTDTSCRDSVADALHALAMANARADLLDSTVTLLDSTLVHAVARADSLGAGFTAARQRLALQESVNAGLRDALKRARPQRIFLAVGAGYGAVLSGGKVQHGPGVQVGLTVPIRLPWPFR